MMYNASEEKNGRKESDGERDTRIYDVNHEVMKL